MLGPAYLPVKRVIRVIFGVLGRMRMSPAQRQSTLAALGASAGIALAGAVVWGLVALLFHLQLSLIGLLIGAGVGLMVARFRPGHLPTIATGAVIAVVGCVLGTLLAMVFIALGQQVGLSFILGHLSLLLHDYPSNVGGLGLLFYAVAAYAAVRVPLRARRRAQAPPPAPPR
jgi:hypothetical protein